MRITSALLAVAVGLLMLVAYGLVLAAIATGNLVALLTGSWTLGGRTWEEFPR